MEDLREGVPQAYEAAFQVEDNRDYSDDAIRSRIERKRPRIQNYLSQFEEAATYNPDPVAEFIDEHTVGKDRLMVRTNFAGGLLLQLTALNGERLLPEENHLETLHSFINYLKILGHQRDDLLAKAINEKWSNEKKEDELKKLGRKQLEEVKIRLVEIVEILRSYVKLYDAWTKEHSKSN